MFISPAYAQAAGGANDMFIQMAPLVLIFVVFYFLLIRPQQKKAKQHRELLAGLRKGDMVITGGGIMGKVVKLEDNVVFVEIAELPAPAGGVRIRVLRATITDVVGKTEPVKEEPAQPLNERSKTAEIKQDAGKKRIDQVVDAEFDEVKDPTATKTIKERVVGLLSSGNSDKKS